MPSTADTGDAKNVANFERAISFCTAYGARYNPANEKLRLGNLQAQFANAKTVLKTVKTTETAFNNATNSRMDAFKPIKGLSTQIINALDAGTASVQTVKNARSINHKIQGSRATPKPAPAPLKEGEDAPADNTISVSQQSFDLEVDHFDELIALLLAEPKYQPNEAELAKNTLETMSVALKANNTAVLNTNTALGKARIDRTKILYGPVAGLVDTALDVKKYVLSIYGATSAEYKQVNSLAFRNFD